MIALAHLAAALVTLAAPDPKPPPPLPPPGFVDGPTAVGLQARGVTVLDVRTAEEFAGGHVPGAINIPHDQVAARSAEVGPKGKPVLLYCRTGRRSGIAAAELARQGFTALYDLRSFSDWPGPVETGPARAK
jgi:rhodanese-related sulfurtransferase